MISPDAARHNFTNEGGAFRRVRFLKNVMGLWILESCRKEWQDRGLHVDYDRLLAEVEGLDGSAGFVFPDDPRFLNPPSMLRAAGGQLLETGQRAPTDPSGIAKVVLDSLAYRYASVLRTIESLTNRTIDGVQIAGGGSQNDYLNQMTATATGLPVMGGPVEAAATGNALIQAIAQGRFKSWTEGRQHIASNLRLKKFSPRPSPASEAAARQYAAIEERYGDKE